jgi:hypothetical protein
MQLPTHIITGVIIQKLCARARPRALALGLTAGLAFLSHGVLDKLAQVTYHPPAPDFHSLFWVSYHSALVLATIVFFCIWWREFRWGITFAILPDLDWVFIHGQEIFHIKIPFYRQPHLHHLLHFIVDKTPPFTYLSRLPNNRHNPWACLWELLLVAALLIVNFSLGRRPTARRDSP